MNFNWQEYYNLASELSLLPSKLSSNSEAISRTVVSRVYYAAFIKARNYLPDKEGKQALTKSSVHSFVIYQFGSSTDPFRRQIGKDLKKLRDFRNRADYEDNIGNPLLIAQKALKLARFTITDLDKL